VKSLESNETSVAVTHAVSLRNCRTAALVRDDSAGVLYVINPGGEAGIVAIPTHGPLVNSLADYKLHLL